MKLNITPEIQKAFDVFIESDRIVKEKNIYDRRSKEHKGLDKAERIFISSCFTEATKQGNELIKKTKEERK